MAVSMPIQTSLAALLKPQASRKHSLTILFHLRWIAALLVVISHLRQNILVDYPLVDHPSLFAKALYWIAGYGPDAVIIFFILSGFLVGRKILDLVVAEDIEHQWPRFLVDRFSRIFIVLWPAMLLTAIIFAGLLLYVPDAAFMAEPSWGWAIRYPIDLDKDWGSWLGSFFLFNEFYTRTLLSDGPLWSLAFEWFYYIFALAIVLLIRRVVSPGAIILITYAVLLFVLSLKNNPAIVLLGSIWVMGVAARLVFDHQILRGAILQYLGIVLFLGVLMLDRIYLLPPYFLGVATAFLIAHTNWAHYNFAGALGRSLADFSYSLYVIHFPLCLVVMAILYKFGLLNQRLPYDTTSLAIMFATLLMIMIVSRLFAALTEDRTHIFRTFILRHAQKMLNRRARMNANVGLDGN